MRCDRMALDNTLLEWLNKKEVIVWVKGIYEANAARLCAAPTAKAVPNQKTRRTKNKVYGSRPVKLTLAPVSCEVCVSGIGRLLESTLCVWITFQHDEK